MIDVEQALGIVLAHVEPGSATTLGLGECLHRTLAEPVSCDVDYPPFDRSVMDGYAVRAVDVERAPARLRLAGQIAAGSTCSAVLKSGEAMQINTGAPIPTGADAVVRVEHTELDPSGGEVLIREAVKAGKFITPKATYVSAGQEILQAGTRMTPLAIGAAATAGASRVTVYHQPKVAILSTGDELVGIERRPVGAQIRNSNECLLAALIASAHSQSVSLGVVGDDRQALSESIRKGLDYDVLCITGGISMGAFDYVPEVLKECGATFHIHKMTIKPGRPTIFATTPKGTLVFALPGNPAGAFVAFELLVRPALAALEGRPGVTPLMMRATLRGKVKLTSDRRTYIPARISVSDDGGWEVEPLSWHGSGDSFGMALANALIMRPAGAEEVTSDGTVTAVLFDRT